MNPSLGERFSIRKAPDEDRNFFDAYCIIILAVHIVTANGNPKQKSRKFGTRRNIYKMPQVTCSGCHCTPFAQFAVIARRTARSLLCMENFLPFLDYVFTKLYQEFLSQFGSTPPSVLPYCYTSLFALFWKYSPCTKLASTLLPVCSRGWPTTIWRNRCSPSRLCSITSSLNRFVNTLPGNGGIVTLALSRSSMSRKYSKSEYRRRTVLCLSLKAGMLVRQIIS